MLLRHSTRGGGCGPGYHRLVPIYEFRCEACGERFEVLADLGTEAVGCRACGAPEARRVLSAQAAPLTHVHSPSATRKREARNAELRRRTKAEFKAARKRARPARGGERG